MKNSHRMKQNLPFTLPWTGLTNGKADTGREPGKGPGHMPMFSISKLETKTGE